MQILDANAVLRFLLDDIPEQSKEVKLSIESGALIGSEVIAECIYVLTSKKLYDIPRADAAHALKTLLTENDISCIGATREALLLALKYFSDTKLDFVDCILAAQSKLYDVPVLTFDKELRNFIDSIAQEN